MPTGKAPEVSERESLKVAEASRQQEWAQPSFMRELFLGNFRLDLVHPYPLPGAERPEFTAYIGRLASRPALQRSEAQDKELAAA